MRTFLLVLCVLTVGVASVTATEPENPNLTQKLAELSKRTEQLDRDAKAKDAVVKSLQHRVDAARDRVSGANGALAIANTELDKAKAALDAADPGTANPAAEAAVKAKEDAVTKAKAALASRTAEQSSAETELAAAQAGADEAARQLAVAQAEGKTIAKQQGNVLALDNGAIYSRSLAALTMLFVLAVLLESAFALLFNWKLFLAYFNTRVVRPPIMFAASLLLVRVFDIDVVANLITTYKTAGTGSGVDSDWSSQIVTALILAGGSAGVNNLMVALGYRQNREEAAPPRPPPDKAWLSFQISSPEKAALTQVEVDITEVPNPTNPPAATAGILTMKPVWPWGILFRNFKRFPQKEGHPVDANKVYWIRVWMRDKDDPTKMWVGLDEKFLFARGAIVDFVVTLRKP